MGPTATLENWARTGEGPAPPSISPKPIGPRLSVMAATVFVCTVGLMGYINWHFRFDLGDDAFIHLRIAHNFLQTGHPYFNPGEHVMVTSSPVWTLLLAMIELLFGMKNTLWVWNAIFVGVAATGSYMLAWSWVKFRGWQEKIVALIVPLA